MIRFEFVGADQTFDFDVMGVDGVSTADGAKLAAKMLRDRADALDPPKVDAEPVEWDVMIDLETWGTRPGCALRSIGAVCFDPYSDRVGPTFYVNVSGGQRRLTLESSTIEWWSKQSDCLLHALTNPAPVRLVNAATLFAEWFKKNNIDNVWAHGAAFDPPILTAAFDHVDVEVPWHYRSVRDTRTLYELAGFDQSAITFVGTPHHALSDATYQALCVQAATSHLFAAVNSGRAA